MHKIIEDIVNSKEEALMEIPRLPLLPKDVTEKDLKLLDDAIKQNIRKSI